MDINKIKFKALFQNIASRQKGWEFSTVNRLDVDFLAFKQHSEWLQFSGLHDKDGHEIYEGDLLQWEDFIVTVVFEAGSFKVLHDGSSDMLLWYCVPKCEVIGNKFDSKKTRP
ncbi:MAG: YopX family protein [Chlorobium sp.]